MAQAQAFGLVARPTDASGAEEDSEDDVAPMDAPPPMAASAARPGDGMTEEEKEAETERLLDLFERLERTGVMRITPHVPHPNP